MNKIQVNTQINQDFNGSHYRKLGYAEGLLPLLTYEIRCQMDLTRALVRESLVAITLVSKLYSEGKNSPLLSECWCEGLALTKF